MFRLLIPLVGLAIAYPVFAQTYKSIDQPPHNYQQRTPTDRFTRWKESLASGQIALDHGSEKAFVVSLLKALEIPASSQVLVFSTTSLQLSLISPSNPRAIYFTDDLYLGYVPGGKIEVVSIDPELGGIYYLFNIPKDQQPPRIERSERCIKCHVTPDTRNVPGLLIKSVLPGVTGGTIDAFRQGDSGHAIPFSQRFGGWYVTGTHGIPEQWGNTIGKLSPQGITKQLLVPGRSFDWAKYPVATSDILPHLLLEHQAGFANRVIEATYRARTLLYESKGSLTNNQVAELDKLAASLTRYLLFADEVPLPGGGVGGNAAFKVDFLRTRRLAPGGISLKDFDLHARLFKYRCSYMIYSPEFQGLPPVIKQRVYRRLDEALRTDRPDTEFAYLPVAERLAIRAILKATLTDLPRAW